MLEFGEFDVDVRLVWTNLKRDHLPPWYELGIRDAEIRSAYTLYMNAASTQLNLLVLGPTKIRNDVPLLTNFGTTAVTSTWPRNQQTGPRASASAGSVLAEKSWWPLKNFAWLLGGVHSRAIFHYGKTPPKKKLGKPRITEVPQRPTRDDLWDPKGSRRPRVLGQELLSLKRSGYRLVEVDEGRRQQLGYTFMPIAPTDRMRISHLVNAVSAAIGRATPFLAEINGWLDDPADPADPGDADESKGDA